MGRESRLNTHLAASSVGVFPIIWLWHSIHLLIRNGNFIAVPWSLPQCLSRGIVQGQVTMSGRDIITRRVGSAASFLRVTARRIGAPAMRNIDGRNKLSTSVRLWFVRVVEWDLTKPWVDAAYLQAVLPGRAAMALCSKYSSFPPPWLHGSILGASRMRVCKA